MLKHALWVRLEAKPGKENAVAEFLHSGLQMAMQETHTPVWFALKLGPSTFGIFEAQAPQLFAKPPMIESVDVLGAKVGA